MGTEIALNLMNEIEARRCVDAINHHLTSARALLLDLYERKGWMALGYSSWRECVECEFGDSQRHLYRQLEAAQVETVLTHGTNQEIGQIPERHLRPLTPYKDEPKFVTQAWGKAQEIAQEENEGKVTAKIVEQAVATTPKPIEQVSILPDSPLEVSRSVSPEKQNTDPELPAPKTHELIHASGTDEHYTPPEIIQAVKDCFGREIELDPASCHVANQIVKAQRIFTIQDDALLQTWIAKTVFMNPPYSEVNKFLTRLVHSYNGGRVTEAIALVKADTSTRWFQLIWQNASMVCFVDHRLKFYGSSDGNATFASAVAYFGSEVDKFYHAFVSFGPVVQVVNSSMFGE